ncbi:hypothetical protein HPP92_027273 [Vanilla planifolia]|uniref:Uncharacterized protein n=1 Tax=Vanilla planifolia TaxID=51239 RepID=A0A835QS58_VANPL|nr:hypothetical protein HPP92_027273 [Vanilla planifolia]KAG0476146.1 hypothetical protein HPP92_012987 [Vanilla planifolia]
MDAKEEAVGAYSSGSNGDVPTPVVVRRTRSKRRRGVGQPTVAASDSSSASGVESGVTDEEEDMANCLILLAQGSGGGAKCVSRRVAEVEATGGGRTGLCVYECKTCNKCFPSFQALEVTGRATRSLRWWRLQRKESRGLWRKAVSR